MTCIASSINCIFMFETVRKKPKSACTVILKGRMNFRGGSREIELVLRGICEVTIEKGYIEDEILEVLQDDLAKMFNTSIQPFSTANIARGRKLCKYIVYKLKTYTEDGRKEICRTEPKDI